MIGRARSFLFVPGDRPDRFAKAAVAGADVVVLDLEDAVVLAAKETARTPPRRLRGAARGRPASDDSLRVDPLSRPVLLHARSTLVIAAAAAGCAPPVDGVTTALSDVDAVRDDTRHAVELGFTGKLCVHPHQAPVVHEAFRPSDEEIAWARSVPAAGDGVTAVDGQMVDRPVLSRARRVLALASDG